MKGRFSLAVVYRLYGNVLRESRPQEAADYYQKELELREEVLKPSPTNKPHRETLARAHAPIALPLRKLGRAKEASEHLKKAAEIENGFDGPTAFTHTETADLLLEEGQRDQSLEYYRTALACAQKVVKNRRQDIVALRELADAYERLGHFYTKGPSEDWREARSWYAKSLTVWTEWTKWGVSSPYNMRREKQASAAVARCDAALVTDSQKSEKTKQWSPAV